MCYQTFVVGWDVLRLWNGSLPWYLCLFIASLKSSLFTIFVCLICSMTILEYIFLCVLKRIPEMDDDLIANRIITMIWILGSIVGPFKFLMNRRPNSNEVM